MKNNGRTKYSNEKGITLIALVVTIIVLLILAGITINLAFNSNGILNRASQAKEQQTIGELKELISLEQMDYETSRKINPSISFESNFQRFKENLKKAGVIKELTDVSDRVDNVVSITSKTRNKTYYFDVTFKQGTDEMLDCEYDNLLGLKVNTIATTNSITVKVIRPEAGTFKISIKDFGAEDQTYKTQTLEKNVREYKFDGLAMNKKFTVKVEQTDAKDPVAPIIKDVMTIDMTKLSITKAKNIAWTGATANVTFEIKNSEVLAGESIEYSTNGGSTWTPVSLTLPGVTTEFIVNSVPKGTTIVIKKKDTTGNSVETSVIIDDTTKPTVKGTKTPSLNTWTKGPVTINVEASDAESGIAKIEYYTTTSTAASKTQITTSTTGSKQFTENINDEIFVVATDKAGNASEAVSLGKIMIDKTAPLVQIGAFSNATPGVGEEINVTLTFTETGSGVNFNNIKYKWSTTNAVDTSYETYTKILPAKIADVSSNQKKVTLPTVAGTNYLHIYAEDTVGNKASIASSGTVVAKEDGFKGMKWDKIASIAKDISNDASITNTTDSISKQGVTLKVGDTGTVLYNGQEKKVRILGFNHDPLTSKTAYGSETATGKAGISFEFVDFLGERNMNSKQTNAGG